MYDQIKAKDIMASRLVTVKPTDDVYHAISVLLSHNISGAPVVDEHGKFMGLFSEKSCMNVLITDWYYGIPIATVQAFANANPITISPETSLMEIGQLFSNTSLRRLPVLDDGRLVGQVSRRDVLKAIHRAKQKGPPKKHPDFPYYSAVGDSSANPMLRK